MQGILLLPPIESEFYFKIPAGKGNAGNTMGQHKKYCKFLFLLLLCSSAMAQIKEPVKIGIYNNSPKVFLNEDGEADGIFIDLLEHIAEKEELEITFVSGEWQELKELLSKGKIDILPDFAVSEENDSLFTINSIPVLSSWLEVYAMKGARLYSIRDLNNKTIGALKGSIQQQYLEEYLQNELALAFDLEICDTYPQCIEALRAGKADLLVASRFFYFSNHFPEDISPTGIIFKPADLYFGFQKEADTQLIQLIDRNLAEMKNDPNSAYYSILHSWLDPAFRKQQPKYFLWILTALLSILLVVLVFTFVLKYQVDLQTKALWRKNRQLTRAKERAEENERLKTIFLQNMSHEIRTPMNGIIGFLSLLKEPNLDPESREKYIDIVNKSGKRLLTTINNIIEISKIDSRQIEVKTSIVDLKEVMNFYYNFFLPQAKEKKIRIELKNDFPPEKAFIKTDKFILDNILTNLINNALKFTNTGVVEIGTSLEGEKVKFYVKDSGIGIPEGRQKAIFERFVQANLNMTRAHEGSGLGLSIVKAYVEILKGEIWLESKEGEGSTFTFTIPYIPAEPTTKTEEPVNLTEALQGEHLKILIAEDDNISFLFIQQLLNKPEITLLRAIDGKQVIELARNNPDLSLILMDIKMPVINGIDATRKIREFNSTVPIIAQSAYSFTGEQEQALKAGCNDYMTKPINKGRLLTIIRKYTRIPDKS